MRTRPVRYFLVFNWLRRQSQPASFFNHISLLCKLIWLHRPATSYPSNILLKSTRDVIVRLIMKQKKRTHRAFLLCLLFLLHEFYSGGSYQLVTCNTRKCLTFNSALLGTKIKQKTRIRRNEKWFVVCLSELVCAERICCCLFVHVIFLCWYRCCVCILAGSWRNASCAWPT